jgi:hypothetical protein
MKTGVPVRFLDEMGSREGCLPAILCYIKNKQKETSNESASVIMKHARSRKAPQTGKIQKKIGALGVMSNTVYIYYG